MRTPGKINWETDDGSALSKKTEYPLEITENVGFVESEFIRVAIPPWDNPATMDFLYFVFQECRK